MEGWIHNALEPRLEGFDFKEIDGVFVFYIPEGRNKPYRASDKIQYYRSETSSQIMPEIMLRSMYLMRSYLDIKISCSFQKLDNRSLVINTDANNLSNIPGTYPRAKIILFPKRSKSNFALKFSGQESEYCGTYSSKTESDYDVGHTITCKNKFSQSNILYPKDKLSFLTLSTSKLPEKILNNNEYIIQVDWSFKERSRKRTYFYFNIDTQKSLVFEEEEIGKLRSLFSFFPR